MCRVVDALVVEVAQRNGVATIRRPALRPRASVVELAPGERSLVAMSSTGVVDDPECGPLGFAEQPAAAPQVGRPGRAAENNVRAHLAQLEAEERVKVHAGKPRRPSVARQQRQEEHVRERQKVIKLAKKYETEQRRAEIRAQEIPASAEWIEPPRYESN